MNEPEGTGPDRDRDRHEDIVLPSWIDAAISRNQEEPVESESELPSALPEDAVEAMSEDPQADEPWEREASTPRGPTAANEPFPAFLDRRSSMEYETGRIAEEPRELEASAEAAEPMEPIAETSSPPPPRTDFLAGRAQDESAAQRDPALYEARSEEKPGSEPIPLPVAPPRRRAPSGPWLVAALFFAAAAVVLGILIWLRPISR